MTLPTFLPPGGAVDFRARAVTPLPWQELPQHPKVLEKPEESSRVLRTLYPAEGIGVLLLAFGDWTDNNGPIGLCGYDLTTGVPVTLMEEAPTEAWERFRVIDGHTYALWTDPTGADGGFTTDEHGGWSNVGIGPMIHTFDLIKFKGALYAVGSAPTPSAGVGRSVVLRRDPRTRRWAEVWTAPEARWSAINRTHSFNRPEWNVPDGELWTLEGYSSTEAIFWRTTDGVTWAEDPAGPRGRELNPYQDRQVWPLPRELHPSWTPETSPSVGLRGTVGGGYVWAYDEATKRVLRTPLR